jgi:hypothetical protein
MVKVITNRAPAFLKAAYSTPSIDLQNHTGFIDPQERYIEWDGSWVIREMTAERVPRFVGRHADLKSAIFHMQ